VPARQVSGDYFDYIHVDEDRLVLQLPTFPVKAFRHR